MIKAAPAPASEQSTAGGLCLPGCGSTTMINVLMVLGRYLKTIFLENSAVLRPPVTPSSETAARKIFAIDSRGEKMKKTTPSFFVPKGPRKGKN